MSEQRATACPVRSLPGFAWGHWGHWRQRKPGALWPVVTQRNAQRQAMVMRDETAAQLAKHVPDLRWAAPWCGAAAPLVSARDGLQNLRATEAIATANRSGLVNVALA